MVNRKARLKAALLASAIPAGCLGLASPAQAQSEPAATAPPPAEAEDAPLTAGDIVVTARRREEALQSVPLAITALSQDALKEKGIDRAEALQFTTPSLQLTNGSEGRQNSSFNIRGLGQAFGGNLPSVITYFADVPLDYRGGAGFTLFDLQNVQIARGPQGTLFGRNTTGGAVLVVPKAPGDKIEGDAQVTIGNYDAREFRGGITLPVTDWASLRVSANIQRRDGYVRDVTTGDDLESQHSDAFRVYLRLKPTDWLQNDTIYQSLKADEGGTAYVLQAVRPGANSSMFNTLNAVFPAGAFANGTAAFLAQQQAWGPRRVATNGNVRNTRNIQLLVNTTTLQLSDDIVLKNIFGYEKLQMGYSTDIDGTPYRINYTFALFPQPENDLRQYTNELQLQGSALDGRLDYVLGGFYLDVHTPGTGFLNGRESLSNTCRASAAPVTAASGCDNPTRNSLDIHDTSKAVFAQANFEIVDNLKLTAGYRYTWDKRRATVGILRSGNLTFAGVPLTATTPNGFGFSCFIGGGAPATTPPDQCLFTRAQKSKKDGYTLGLDYQITPRVLVYAVTRKGYKAGGSNNVFSVQPGFETYVPEVATDYELGLKADYDVGSLRMRTNADVFYAKYDNLQRQLTFTSAGVTATVIIGAEKADIKGFEIEQSVFFTRDLSLSAFYSYLDPKYKTFVNPGTGADLSSNKFYALSKHQGGATLRYAHDLESGAGEIGGSVSWFAKSKAPYTTLNVTQDILAIAPSYSLVNARLDWKRIGGTAVDVGLFVNNLTKEDYVLGGIGLYGGVLGYNSANYGEPRMYGVQLSYRFGG